MYKYADEIRVRLHCSENDIASRWVHRESNLKFRLNSDEKHRKNSLSLNVKEPVPTQQSVPSTSHH